MHLFAKFGSIEAMYYCLRLKISPNFKTSITYKDYPSATSLHIACGYSQLEMCKFLLTSSLTDVNAKDLNGNSPLHYSGLSGTN
jgi:ankyrin repeat protein